MFLQNSKPKKALMKPNINNHDNDDDKDDADGDDNDGDVNDGDDDVDDDYGDRGNSVVGK